MSNQRYTPEFKEEAVLQVVERGHSVAGVADRLEVSSHSLYNWVKAIKPGKTCYKRRSLTTPRKRFSL